MYAFVPGKLLCLVYEDFYLAILIIFYDFIRSLRVQSSQQIIRLDCVT